MKNRKSYQTLILEHLQKYGSINREEAQRLYNCQTLEEQIYGLRKKGYKITTSKQRVKQSINDKTGRMTSCKIYYLDKKTTYTVEITEVLQKQIKVEAESEEQAIEIAKDLYYSGEEVLYPEDLKETTFFLVVDFDITLRGIDKSVRDDSEEKPDYIIIDTEGIDD